MELRKVIIGMLFIMTTYFQVANADPTFAIIPPEQMQTILPLIQKMRVENYYHYPYLYASNGAEHEDVSYYQTSRKTTIGVAKDHDQILGVIVAIPLNDFNYEQNSFSAKKEFAGSLGDSTKGYYYISELLFTHPESPDAFHDELGKQLITLIEHAIKEDKDFQHISMLVVERHGNHPLKTRLYIDETKALRSLGYKKTRYIIHAPWITRTAQDKTEYQNNPMRLWSKSL
jgi:hypothetical protein